MADLPLDSSALPIVIVGANTSGVPATPIGSSLTGDLTVRDSINTLSINGAISISTTAVEAKVGASRLTNRKFISITPTNGIIYWGSSSSVTIVSGTPVFKNQSLTMAFTDNVAVWLISAATVDVRIVEGS
jgi:hypothetical protein